MIPSGSEERIFDNAFFWVYFFVHNGYLTIILKACQEKKHYFSILF